MSEPIDTDSEGNPLTLSDIVYTDDTIADDLDKKIKIEKTARIYQRNGRLSRQRDNFKAIRAFYVKADDAA